MNPAQLAELKAAITAKIEQTQQTISAQQGDSGAIAPDNAIGRVSRVAAMYDKQVNEGTLKRAKDRLAKLEYALERVDTPEFGICQYCSQPIPPARIVAMPESTTCMRCAAFG
ncbi:MAG: conjugal transfer protein TraR [Victivallales bacterium]|jgi:DnaK suppressor protein|nr:conjugal transfer protein TraR [Victivallales bacterium]MBT7301827.1 conjugal transfer protein TraR [Victivallales bacterium]